MIKIENLNKYFYRHKKNEIHVINNVTLELKDKGLVALIGPSGCGKTTLLNAISGLDKTSSGKIFVNGKRISKTCSSKVDKIRNINIGYIFQDYNLIDNLSVFDNVALSLKLIGIKNKSEIKRRVDFVLERVGMYRYRNKYAGMLSGGERQRIGIARAIVKDPSVIIADEPTGNLDSRNTLEIMNIIKAISKTRLVILVTHEKELAEFYASRILEIEDGKILKDRTNNHANELDYRLDNKIYLKDFKNQETISNDNLNVNYYSDNKEKININIVVTKEGNIFINGSEKLEIIKNDSAIELVDDHYKKISKSIYEEYDFDFDKVIDKQIKPKYSSIFNIFSLISNGFKKVRDYTSVKKLLLIGFFVSSMFITYSISSLFGINHIDESEYLKYDKNYVIVEDKVVKVNDYLAFEKDENIDYIIPGNSMVIFNIRYPDYYQTANASDFISGSLSSIDKVSEKDLIAGSMPKNNKEIVLDKIVYDNYMNTSSAKQVGLFEMKDLIGRKVKIKHVDYIISGISNTTNPCIYAYKSEFLTIISNQSNDSNYINDDSNIDDEILDYNLVTNSFKLKKGRLPKKDYEVIINYNYKDQYKLNKTINYKVNGKKLKVVGYYTSKYNMETYLVNSNTVKYKTILETENIMINPIDKELAINTYINKISIKDSYTTAKDNYIKTKKDDMRGTLIFSVVILIVSLIEIYLMIRSSFISKIKEVGIYRAIGMKKIDIYKMFSGEIIAITTIASLPGIALMSYSLYQLLFIDIISNKFMVNSYTVLITIVFVYTFNLLIGLLPVALTLRKTPAQILSRSDI